MKKFIMLLTTLLLFLAGAYYLYFFDGFFVNTEPDQAVDVVFSSDTKNIYVNNGNKKEALSIKGVILESVLPGHYFSDYAIDEETYLSYFEDIAEMGANTIRIKRVMNPEFYDALAEFNEDSREPIYILQGVGMEDYDQNNSGSYYDHKTVPNLVNLSKQVVDVVHGRANIGENKINGSGRFRSDVSEYCVGYIVGDYWFESTIAYTNHTESIRTEYKGDYFQTTENANDFEAIMAEVMDQIVEYESNKYKTQRLVSFINEPSSDPFLYLYDTRTEVDKYVEIDHENIVATENLQSGYFASYNMYPYIPSFSEHIDESDTEIADFVQSAGFRSLSAYDGYVQLLTHYHTMPVLVASYGYSTARGVESKAEEDSKGSYAHLTEEQQGEHLVKTYEDMLSVGVAGAVVSSWQDNWSLTTWNTQYAVDELHEKNWKDVQTPENQYGLLSYEPGEKESVSYVDGDFSEWTEEDLLSSNEDLSLHMKYDNAYAYFYIEGANIDGDDVYYIPIDTTPKSGSRFIQSENVYTDRETDFLIKIDGKENSRMLVQEYSNSALMEYGNLVDGRNRFYRQPHKDSSLFEPIVMIEKKGFDPEYKSLGTIEVEVEEEKEEKNLLPVFESGKLKYGNGHPDASDYYSLADFYAGDTGIEIRIPWQLLNVADPSHMMIHDDYYEHYGVETMRMKSMYAGIGRDGTIKLEEKELKTYKKPDYHERLKKSYFILQEAWTK